MDGLLTQSPSGTGGGGTGGGGYGAKDYFSAREKASSRSLQQRLEQVRSTCIMSCIYICVACACVCIRIYIYVVY